MARVAALAAFAAMGALIGGSALYVAFVAPGAASDCRSGQVAGDIGGPFTLVDQTGTSVTDKQVFTKPALVYFGYTFCPDVCPLDNARNGQAVDILETKGFDVNPVFITIDPARDTVPVMADYAANIHPKMIALTGTAEQVDVASKAYRTFYQKQDGDAEFYMMSHSTFTYLVLPDTGFADFFDRETTPEVMADRVACFLRAAPAV
jgi:protein SCO1